MSMQNKEATLPAVYGTEEETGLMVDTGKGWIDPNYLADNLAEYIPPHLKYATSRSMFLSNGSLIYIGGAKGANGSDNIERATPECISPKQLATYIHANELLMRDIARNYALDVATDTSTPVSVRIQRRVVDSQGNRKGCHDNFGIEEPIDFLYDPHKKAALVGFLATRSFIVGAGHVTNSGYRFAQKIHGLHNVVGYGYEGYMYRVVQDHNDSEAYSDSTGSRLEIRCSDINISPWAIQMRIGGMALLLAASQTELIRKIRDISPASDPLLLARAYNYFSFYSDGEVIPSENNINSLDYQERIIDVFLFDLPEYVDLPPEYLQIAIELKQFCQDYRKVLKNELPLSVLADRADYAAKYTKLISVMKNWNAELYRSSMFERAKYDFLYDYIGISSDKSGQVTEKVGNAYRMRDRGEFAMSPAAKEITHAYTMPPAETRARIRGDFIRRHMAQVVEWNDIEYPDRFGNTNTIHLPDPLQNTLSDSDAVRVKKSAISRN